MILFEWGFRKPSIENTYLFGKHVDFPLKTIRIGFAIITYIPNSTESFLKDALRGLARDADWLIENDREMDRKQKEIWEEMEKRHQEDHMRDYKKIEELRKDVSDLKNENRHLRKAIEIVKEGV